MDPATIHDEMERARTEFHRLAEAPSPAALRQRSHNTRWTNRQLLFHLVFGYLIVRTLLPLVRLLGRLGWSRRFAATLNAGRRPFHLVNHLGSCGGGQILSIHRMTRLLDRTIQALQRSLVAATPTTLDLTMHFPTDWDPYFQPTMSVLDVYHYGTQHFDHHRHQLTI